MPTSVVRCVGVSAAARACALTAPRRFHSRTRHSSAPNKSMLGSVGGVREVSPDGTAARLDVGRASCFRRTEERGGEGGVTRHAKEALCGILLPDRQQRPAGHRLLAAAQVALHEGFDQRRAPRRSARRRSSFQRAPARAASRWAANGQSRHRRTPNAKARAGALVDRARGAMAAAASPRLTHG